MTTIKRYANRKLYDTEAKQYITLDGIADLIRQGTEVTVVDHGSGEDVTALVLTQIIMEQEKKAGGFLPRTLLTTLIQAGGDTLQTLRRAAELPVDFARHVDAEIERRVQALLHQGRLSAQEAGGLREKLFGARDLPAAPLDEVALRQALIERGMPTRDALAALTAQVEALTAEIEALRQREAQRLSE